MIVPLGWMSALGCWRQSNNPQHRTQVRRTPRRVQNGASCVFRCILFAGRGLSWQRL